MVGVQHCGLSNLKAKLVCFIGALKLTLVRDILVLWHVQVSITLAIMLSYKMNSITTEVKCACGGEGTQYFEIA